MENEHSNNCKLTEHMVLTKTRANSLSDITQINIWGFNLKDVSIFEKMENVEIAALSINHISSLRSFANCKKLKQLLLRHNDITDFNQLDYLVNLPNLTNLSLIENPISEDINYRSKVSKKLPQLKILDSVEINDADKSTKINTDRSTKIVNVSDNITTFSNENYSKKQLVNQPITEINSENQSPQKKHRKHRPNVIRERDNYFENEDYHQLNESCSQKNYYVPNNYQKARTFNNPREFNYHLSQRNNCSGNNSILIAILSLLPELTNEDLNVVLNSVQQRIYLNQCE